MPLDTAAYFLQASVLPRFQSVGAQIGVETLAYSVLQDFGSTVRPRREVHVLSYFIEALCAPAGLHSWLSAFNQDLLRNSRLLSLEQKIPDCFTDNELCCFGRLFYQRRWQGVSYYTI